MSGKLSELIKSCGQICIPAFYFFVNKGLNAFLKEQFTLLI